MSIAEKIEAYHGKIAGNVPWRYRSWEHCFGFFRGTGPAAIHARQHDAALQLGFYLASWGMYRGSSRLLQYDYTIHLPVVDRLADPALAPLWQHDVGSNRDDDAYVPLILLAVTAVREGHRPYLAPTDTLVTKVLLGVLGCLPACDRFFIDGFTSEGFQYSCLNRHFVNRAFAFCRENLQALQTEQVRIATNGGVHYPLMKLVDMYFWQIGYERWAEKRGVGAADAGPPE